jgi:uncharacterized protein (DUF1800 family)
MGWNNGEAIIMNDVIELERARRESAASVTEPVPPLEQHQDPSQYSQNLARMAVSGAALAALAACGGGSGGGGTVEGGTDGNGLPGSGGARPAQATPAEQPAPADAARFLTQATFGIQSTQQIAQTQQKGLALWLWEQFNTGFNSHVEYLEAQKQRNIDKKGVARATDEMSYEAIWQQWLYEPGQLRARVAFALSEIVVISNIAPDLRPYAMSSYMDMLNRNAFGNYRQLLKDVTLHPAMGYYLNMLNSERDNPETGAHPNENYAREILQLFSIGLVQLNPDGTPRLDGAGQPIPTYGEEEVRGFAKAFTGWSYANARAFDNADEEAVAAWTQAMKAFPAKHSPEAKQLLNGVVLAAGGTPEKDLEAALDNIFQHANVGPFICRQLIQRLVTSNPSPGYIARVAAAFANNGAGVRGDLRAVVSAILLDAEARAPGSATTYGKQREPVIRFANFLRALNARSKSGINAIHYLEDSDNGLGQSPLLSPSVFNFFSPNFRPSGAIAQAGLVAPEFQITTETTVVGGLNFFTRLFKQGGYGWGDDELKLDYAPLRAIAGTPDTLIAQLDALFFNFAMSASLKTRMRALIASYAPQDTLWRVKAALILTSLSPEFIIQK